MSKYSESERILLNHFNLNAYAEMTTAIHAWRTMAEVAFLLNEQSPYADAVRRGLEALNDHHILRDSKEFDELIRCV